MGEVIVTAERRQSTVQQTPISITALNGAQLAARGITSVEGLVMEVPGLSMRSAGPGQTEYEARGLSSTGGAAPTVGFYLNDVPMTPPAAAQTGKVVIDPDLYDIDHIEVLRGPQGTLYGSGSMGGTIRVVTAQPKLGVYAASAQATVSGTEGGGVNDGFNAMVNIPLGDKLALRIVGTDISRSGWIDRIVLQDFPADGLTRGDVANAAVAKINKDVNTEQERGIRASLLFQPNADLTIVGGAFYQSTKMGGYDEYDLPPGQAHEAHYEAFNTPEPYNDTVAIFNLTATQNLGFASLTSATGYWNRNETQTQDAAENLAYSFGFSSLIPFPYSENDRTSQFSEEIRLASPEKNKAFTWVTGVFFTHLNSLWHETSQDANPVIISLSPPGDNPNGILLDTYNPYRVDQVAAFGDASYSLTPTIKISAGVRWDSYQSALLNDEYGLGVPPYYTNHVGTRTTTSASAITPRFNISYMPNRSLTAYITASEGFRPGGLNMYVPAYCGASPTSYSPDSVWNYEVGEKAKLFENRVTINADFYYIDWYHVQQLLLLQCGDEYYDNAGNGRSFGPELETSVKITNDLSLNLAGAYTDAEVTHPTPILANNVLSNALPGSINSCTSISNCTLPILNVPKYTGNVSLNYSTKIFEGYNLTGRVIDSYVGPVVDESFYPIINLAPYNIVNMRVSLSKDKWTGTFFANNLTNTKAQISANNTSFQFNIPAYVRVSTNQPLTAGIELSYAY